MLRALELAHAELSVLLTDDAQIRELNAVHRHKPRPTDVLAFPLDGERLTQDVPLKPIKKSELSNPKAGWRAPLLLGDVVISLDTAARQARGRDRDLYAEVRFLLAHGVLHLIGYDHATPAEKRVMTAKTRWLVRNAE